MTNNTWHPLGRVSAERLADARRQLHWAAQAVSAVGKRLLEHQADYGEQSFRWSEEARALAQGTVSGIVPESEPFRPALRPSPPALLLLDAGSRPLRELPLDGRTLEKAFRWLEEESASLLGRPLDEPLDRSADIEAHPVGSGAPFSAADAEAFEDLSAWFGNAHRLLTALVERNSGASAVRCWPHHFDIATLIQLDSGEASETARSIGAGLSPGDTGRPAPYLYVTPWPYPSTDKLPDLEGGGVWNTQGWVGAVLDAATLLDGSGDPAHRAERFVASAVAGSRTLLAAP